MPTPPTRIGAPVPEAVIVAALTAFRATVRPGHGLSRSNLVSALRVHLPDGTRPGDVRRTLTTLPPDAGGLIRETAPDGSVTYVSPRAQRPAPPVPPKPKPKPPTAAPTEPTIPAGFGVVTCVNCGTDRPARIGRLAPGLCPRCRSKRKRSRPRPTFTTNLWS